MADQPDRLSDLSILANRAAINASANTMAMDRVRKIIADNGLEAADLPPADDDARNLLLSLVDQHTPMVQPQSVAPYYDVNDGEALSVDILQVSCYLLFGLLFVILVI